MDGVIATFCGQFSVLTKNEFYTMRNIILAEKNGAEVNRKDFGKLIHKLAQQGKEIETIVSLELLQLQRIKKETFGI
jgi:hypothetical protein